MNLESADWWKELLEFETLTKKQVEERYKVQIKEGESLIVLNASRQHTYLRSDNNHSWFVVVTKKENEKGEDKYHVLPMGKYATYYAQNDLELFFFIFGTQPASICYPDENMFYYHREKCNLPLVAKPHHFSRFMDKVRRDMILAKEGKLYFQSQGNNCATWLQETLDYAFEGQVLPRFFEIDVLETTGPFPVNKIISTLNSIKQATAHSVANVCRILFCTAFGAAWQGYSPEWSNKTYRFIPIEELNRALDALYKIALYAYQLATHRLLGTQDPSIRLKDNATWLEGKLLLPSYLFHTASEYRRALSPAST